MKIEEFQASVIDRDRLPDLFPTHAHPAAFWEALGRAVAAFGFLEETLGRAIFSFTATVEVPEDEIEAAYAKWLLKLERALSDPLGPLIRSYEKAVLENKGAEIPYLNDLIKDLQEASVLRNVICHGSWRTPDEHGRSRPHFVNNKTMVFQEEIDAEYLIELRRRVSRSICTVMDTVTGMGWQFPGAGGPGRVIVASTRT